MAITKLKDNSPDAMKSEGIDSLDTFIRRSVGKEPLFSFSRVGDSPVQWIQLLNGLDQQDVAGWPLLSPIKVKMHKCERCSREFCSTITFRRHMRVHRRTLSFDKDSTKTRDLLGVFWDKLSLDQVKEVVSFKNVQLEDVPGSSIIESLASLTSKPGFHSLPQVYANAGSAILDIIQSRPSRFPMSSQKLFSVFDDASEGTFLCAGMPDSVKKYVFDGEAGKIGLEMKNLIACTCFLLEQNLIKAWLTDMDAEALRCQKLLVEEEEADQRRQAELLERKRKKKLRQREQKAKEQTCVENTNIIESTADTMDDMHSGESSNPVDTPQPASCIPMAEEEEYISSRIEHTQYLNDERNTDTRSRSLVGNSDHGNYQHIERSGSKRNGHQRGVTPRWKVQNSHGGTVNGFPGKTPNNLRVSAPMHGTTKVWTRKPKQKTYDKKFTINRADQISDCCEMLIGSIPVTLTNCCAPQDRGSLVGGARDNSKSEHVVPMKLWRPVSRHGSIKDSSQHCSGSVPVQSDYMEPDVQNITVRNDDWTNGVENDGSVIREKKINSNYQETKGVRFNSEAAKAFLSQRLKEAIAADHVKLVLYPVIEKNQETTQLDVNDKKRSILGNAENRITNTVTAKFRSKSEKGVKLKYVPKQQKN